jgi:hypothetical protein
MAYRDFKKANVMFNFETGTWVMIDHGLRQGLDPTSLQEFLAGMTPGEPHSLTAQRSCNFGFCTCFRRDS